MTIKVDQKTRDKLLELRDEKKIYLEGNILKLIETEGDEELADYVEDAIARDKANRRKRLDVTRKVQSQNSALEEEKKENVRVNRQLTKALEEADVSKNDAIRAKEEAEMARHNAETSRNEAVTAKLEAEHARIEALKAKEAAEGDLELIQKKSQFELIGTIVKVALWVILGVGVTTTLMYVGAMATGVDTTVVGSTWTNIIGIMLTNAFSIVGTIMGVKYASGNGKSDE